MPCDSNPNLTPIQKRAQVSALDRLNAALAAGTVTVIIGQTGAIAFKGWGERNGLTDICAYRRLTATNSPALRKALARAEAMTGRKVDARQVAAGTHSHDEGGHWHPGH